MRTPSESRENVRELMRLVGLDYYDRFEWLLRSEMRCGDDNLLVVRKPAENLRIQSLEQAKNRHLHPSDVVEINNLSDIQSSNAKLIEDLFSLLQSGVQIYIRSENRYIDDNERRTMLYLLRNMLECIDRNNRNRREEGIEEAKRNGRYTGRKPIEVDEQLLKQVAIAFLNNRLSEQEAMGRLGINSRSTFYRKIRSFRE
jgi:DNA invertase Pin-like site-specific DNA recombinase